MKLLTSPCGYIDTLRPGMGIKDTIESGFKNMLLNFELGVDPGMIEQYGKSNYKSNNYNIALDNPDRLPERMKVFLDKAAANKIEFPVALSPYIYPTTKLKDIEDKLFELAVNSMKICESVSCRQIIVRPLFAGIADGEMRSKNKAFYLQLAKVAKERDIQILIEPQCKDMNGHMIRSFFADEVVLSDFIDELNKEVGNDVFGACMNVGTLSLCRQNMYDYAITLGDKIKAVIIRSCIDENDRACLPFSGIGMKGFTADWLNLFRGLRKISFDGNLIMDFKDEIAPLSPMLRPHLLSMAYETAKYFMWQIEMEKLTEKYDSCVLFGAGNMCRNYMKNYGERLRPLFTCDNNSSLWGQSFESLEIKSPEEIKKLDTNTAIFICNIYYREIATQLREMNINNPIEFFNDEYMPTFHFDRIDSRTRKSDKE